ncbi:hypothetical protein HaLaN_05370, partial [Haematococcus lacustris]
MLPHSPPAGFRAAADRTGLPRCAVAEKTGSAIGVIRCGQPHVTPDVSQSQTVVSYTGRLARM